MAKKTKRTVTRKAPAKKVATKKRSIASKSAMGKAVLRIKRKKISADKKENYCVAAIFGLIAITIIAASVMLLIENNSGNIGGRKDQEVVEPVPPEEKKDFEFEGWINCQPMLTDEQAELCRQAEEAGYDKIAY